MSAVEVDRLRHRGGRGATSYVVGGVDGLRLKVKPSGARSWILRAMVGGRRREIGLGGYPDLSLAEARRKAKEKRAEIEKGVDPVEERRAARAALLAAQAEAERRRYTFGAAFESFMERKAAELGSEKRAHNWSAGLRLHVLPALAETPVAEITRDDVLAVLTPIWTEKTTTAARVRQRLEAILQAAIVEGHRAEPNPARWAGNLDALLPAPGRIARVTHHPALSLAEAPAWFADLRARSGNSARALEFAALTAARSGEVRGATWEELDPAAKMWVIPAARMKAGKPHRVPLTERMVALLEAQPRRNDSAFVFPAKRGGALSDMALSSVMRKIAQARPGCYLDPETGRPAVPHGLRSTFRNWTAETGVDRDLAEICLAHTVGSAVERAYRRSDMVERRREVLAAWGAFVAGGGDAAPGG